MNDKELFALLKCVRAGGDGKRCEQPVQALIQPRWSTVMAYCAEHAPKEKS